MWSCLVRLNEELLAWCAILVAASWPLEANERGVFRMLMAAETAAAANCVNEAILLAAEVDDDEEDDEEDDDDDEDEPHEGMN